MLIPFKPETSQPVYVGIEYGNLCSCLNVCVQFCLVDFVLYKKGEKGWNKKYIPVATPSLLQDIAFNAVLWKKSGKNCVCESIFLKDI